MVDSKQFDLLIKKVRIIRPNTDIIIDADVAIQAGKIARIAELTSFNPARRFGLNRKGDLAEGLDADIVLVDPGETWVVRAKDSESQQGYTPYIQALEVLHENSSQFNRPGSQTNHCQRDCRAS